MVRNFLNLCLSRNLYNGMQQLNDLIFKNIGNNLTKRKGIFEKISFETP